MTTVHKYYVRPADAESETAALDEIARYVQARNRLLRLREKWLRIKEDMILPEYRVKAAELRVTPRTGRKPTLKVEVHCAGPRNERAREQSRTTRLPQNDELEGKLEALRARWETVEIARTDVERSDLEELRAADSRALYAEFIEAGGSYATWWLVEAASKKAKHPVRDEHAGRAGILPENLRWEGTTMHYGGTAWTVHQKQLARRPVPANTRVAQAWLQRERTSTSLLRQPRYSWFLVLVLDMPTRMHDVSNLQRTAAGLDIAWRQDDDTLRVAYVADGTDNHQAIRMPARAYARLQHAASIAALADQDANLLRAEFGVPANTSHRRLLELASPNHGIAVHLVHLAEWHHGQRRNAIASRDEHYLHEIQKLCAAHHTIFIEEMKGNPKLVQKRSTRRKHSGKDDEEGGVARDQRQMAAPFMFLARLKAEASKFNTTLITVPPAYTSRICAQCGCDMGASGKLERRCPECDTVWDVDHLAALNLLYWGQNPPATSNDTNGGTSGGTPETSSPGKKITAATSSAKTSRKKKPTRAKTPKRVAAATDQAAIASGDATYDPQGSLAFE